MCPVLDGTGQLERFDVISESCKAASCQAFYCYGLNYEENH